MWHLFQISVGCYLRKSNTGQNKKLSSGKLNSHLLHRRLLRRWLRLSLSLWLLRGKLLLLLMLTLLMLIRRHVWVRLWLGVCLRWPSGIPLLWMVALLVQVVVMVVLGLSSVITLGIGGSRRVISPQGTDRIPNWSWGVAARRLRSRLRGWVRRRLWEGKKRNRKNSGETATLSLYSVDTRVRMKH